MPDWGYLLIIAAVAVVAGLMVFGRDRSRRVGDGKLPPRRPRRRPPHAGGRDSFASLPPGVAAEVADLLARSRKIEAIKLVREVTGMDLRSAKEFVEDQARVLDRSGQG